MTPVVPPEPAPVQRYGMQPISPTQCASVTELEGPFVMYEDFAALSARCTALDAERVKLREAISDALRQNGRFHIHAILDAALASSAVPPTETEK